jgi:DNA-binding response OmpR family regulator
MENQHPNPKARPTILLVGNDAALGYLIGRFAERSGYQLTGFAENLSVEQIANVKPAVVIFLSTELLARNQVLVTELTKVDSPIMVCSSLAEEARARELGADYCLLHPLTYDEFKVTLVNASELKGT